MSGGPKSASYEWIRWDPDASTTDLASLHHLSQVAAEKVKGSIQINMRSPTQVLNL